MTTIDVDDLLGESPSSSTKMLCYKTVDVFAGILQRKLWLKDSRGGNAQTNGYLIEVPFRHPRAYQYTEHEISHILFQSDVRARTLFTVEFSKKIALVAEKSGVRLNPREIRQALDEIVNLLDDERVLSLWGLLYRGSEAIMRRMKLDEAIPALPFSHDNILTLIYCLASRNEVPPGQLDRYRPYVLEALRKVHLRDYFGTLVAARWLMVQLVSELIRESRKEPPPNLPPSLNPAIKPSESPESEEPLPPNAENNTLSSSEVWIPPEVESSSKERSEALQEVLKQIGKLPTYVLKTLNDVSESQFTRTGEESKAQQIANAAIRIDVKDGQKLESTLEMSASKMLDIVNRARRSIKNAPNHDDALRQDSYAKVIFSDIVPSENRDPHIALAVEDAVVVQRLRSVFHKVMGRRKNVLEECGTEIDIPAYIARRLSQDDQPVFRMDRVGRGFRALILIDRSSSMEGERTTQAERSCKIISRALKFPFVHTSVWGFQSWHEGEVNITRFRPGAEIFDSEAAAVGGITPLHTAIRVALRELGDSTDLKHLFILSDGFPVFAKKGGEAYGTQVLMGFVRSNIMQARTKGIGVTGLMIGNDVPEKKMSYMFGPSRNWRILDEQTLSKDLVEIVSQSFINYLKSR